MGGALFTFQRNLLGRGIGSLKTVWKIYEGTELDNKLVHYCVENYAGGITRCWHNQTEYDEGRRETGAEGAKTNPCAVVAAPSAKKVEIFVNKGEDTALLVALGVVVNLKNEKSAVGEEECEEGEEGEEKEG